MNEAIHTEVHEGVQRIEMRRPEKKNALTIAMYAALAAALREAESDDRVRVILLHGQPGVFTSGNDVHDFLEHPPQSMDDPVFQFLRCLIHTRKPVVAAVAGDAVGIGTTMLLHCDYVIAGESARFSMPFANLGLCPEAASSVALPLLIGWRRASELLLLGNAIDAGQACDWGLINRVVPDAQLPDATWALVRSLAVKSPAALRATKVHLREKLMPLFEQALAEEARDFHELLQTPAAQEALRAFVEKRAKTVGKL